MCIENSNITTLDYVVVLLFLVISGNPITVFTSDWLYIIVSIILVIISLSTKKKIFDNFLFRWMMGFVFVFICQAAVGELVSIPADINFLSKIYSCFLVASILGVKFRYVYMRVMVLLSLISLPLFFINYIGIEFSGIRFDRYVSLVLYNYIPKSQFIDMRNAGMFWEPGAFQGYILLVPLLYTNSIQQFYKTYKKESFILFLALLSTMSTTGYLTFGVFIFLVLFKNVKNPFLRVVSIVSIICISMWMFNSLDFIGGKIVSEYNNAMSMSNGDISWTRMGSAQIDLLNIARHPIIGNGFIMEQKYPGIGELMAGAGNGFTGVINSFGIPLMLMFFITIYRNAPSEKSYFKLVFLVIYIMLLNGEYFLNYPFFWIVIFLIYPSNRNFMYIKG